MLKFSSKNLLALCLLLKNRKLDLWVVLHTYILCTVCSIFYMYTHTVLLLMREKKTSLLRFFCLFTFEMFCIIIFFVFIISTFKVDHFILAALEKYLYSSEQVG